MSVLLKVCPACGVEFSARADAVTCSPKCRQRWSRGRRGNDVAMERMVTAHHEAGHAVASAMCGGTVYRIDIDGGAEHLGKTFSADADLWVPLVIYGGVWAEARLKCAPSTTQFATHLRTAIKENGPDGDVREYAEVVRQMGHGWDTRLRQNTKWDMELEMFWPAVQRVAALTLAGAVGFEADIPKLLRTR